MMFNELAIVLHEYLSMRKLFCNGYHVGSQPIIKKQHIDDSERCLETFSLNIKKIDRTCSHEWLHHFSANSKQHSAE